MSAPAGAPARRRQRLAAADRRARIEEAARTCIAEGGMRAFTVDRVAARAGVSRALIAHHFGSMEGLLVALYARMYRDSLAELAVPRPGLPPLAAVVEALVGPPMLDREVLGVWLALWGETAANPVLRDEHRRFYAAYRTTIAAAIRAEARPGTDAEGLAAALICLADGFAVQRCVEPDLLGEAEARAAVWALLAPYLAEPPSSA